MLTMADLVAALGIDPAAAADRAWAQAAVDGINTYVDRLPHVTPGAWDAMTHLGATMLAQRAYAARSAPLGAAGMDVTGSLVRATTDPEVGRLLRVGRYATPRAR